ncbi:MAG: 3-deoxy-7-phosphoheptulonate synthase [Clostridia bacterium]|nr:3-deoxy-7-phosphoheptulonate synthase [Clostridia bacterium]
MQKGMEKLMKNAPLAVRKEGMTDTIIEVKGVKIGGGHITMMAGPCSVESREQIMATAAEVKAAGAQILRGGAFKPRTSPYSFQGLGEEGLKLLKEAGEKYNMPVITEVMEIDTFDLVESYADILQIGARNMSNFSLLKRAGKSKKPILLKRGMSSTIEEFLMSAEYILANGNPQVILCERGIRTFETMMRNTLDLASIPLIKELSHLPIIIDPSHGTGIRELVAPMSKAAVVIGGDGLMVEVHHKPEEALCDGPQSLTPEIFTALMAELNGLSNFSFSRG